ncbi:SIR2 family protein [Mariniradius sediminis]|uniref:SIR2 family protein n=1 Tax=Mariniradius sediminis TaxID=2909237 RepID=A0ABS9BZU0_9BACT|nr:SIR2 family protein [Mariniradius sediminis]MCF1752952.1 SIR2 family protein [Mariniradius sediminis]
MREIKIEHLAYHLKQARAKNKPQPIFFLGAGASKSGQIPLADEIARKILKEYPGHPFIEELPASERSYAKLMGCLLPNERDELLKEYIDRAKINVTHIYLAQLIKEGYVDYVLTVNFDNLMLRALALYNIFPSTYDMAILNDLTTSTFKEKSVVYLHGQHHGLWLLNTPEEMERVKMTVPKIFDSIKNRRPWIFLGYSGEDPIFEHIRNLGRFDNGLYWVIYKDNLPDKNVLEFISDVNSNGFLIRGYDSDSFMLKLNRELGLEQPTIVDKPFTAMQNLLEEIVDIDEEEHFKGVKERLDISKRQVEDAILQYELGETETSRSSNENKIDLLKREIIDLIISEKFDDTEISEIEKKVIISKDSEASKLLGDLYFHWGVFLGKLAQSKSGIDSENLFFKSLKKYEKCIDINPERFEALNNWGGVLVNLARMSDVNETEKFYKESFSKFQLATEIKPEFAEAFYNWGISLRSLARMKTGEESEDLFSQSLIKLLIALELKPNDPQYLSNLGVSFLNFAYTKDGQVAEELFQKSIETFGKALKFGANDYSFYYSYANCLQGYAKMKSGEDSYELNCQSVELYQKALEKKPDDYEAYLNWGYVLAEMAHRKEGSEQDQLFKESFEKFNLAIQINPNFQPAYYNLGFYMGMFAKSKDGIDSENLLRQSFTYFQRAIELDCDDEKTYFSWGNNLAALAEVKNGEEAERLFLEAFKKYEEALRINPKYPQVYYNWGNFLGALAKKKDLSEKDDLYLRCFRKFEEAVDIKADYFEAYNNWGVCLFDFALQKEGEKQVHLYQQAIEKFLKVFELTGRCYSLASMFAKTGNIKEVFHYLEVGLKNNEVSVNEVIKDEDWISYNGNPDFQAIIAKFLPS